MACSQDKDNIYTLQKGEDRMRGTVPVPCDNPGYGHGH